MIEPRFCVRCGNRLRQVQLEGHVRHACSHCGHVHYLNPIVAAGAVVEAGGCVLLVRRAVPPRQGMWAFPAGYAEIGEHPTDTARRETLEETGIEIELDAVLDIFAFGGGDQPYGILVLYKAHAHCTETRAGDDALEAQFFAPADLPHDIAFEAHRRALQGWCSSGRSDLSDDEVSPCALP